MRVRRFTDAASFLAEAGGFLEEREALHNLPFAIARRCASDPNRYPVLGTVTGAPVLPDENQNRPPRTNQFSIGVQREITRNFTIEAAYVANRAVWLGSGNGVSGGPAGPLGNLSRISPQQFAAIGLYP